jgi:lipopolysaccharide biosynthesis regulator YciM
MEYKIGRAMARLAEDDPSQRPAAIDALQAFRKKHPDSWQLINATKILVGLLTAADNHAAAARALDELAATKNIPKETRQWAELEAAQALVRAKQLTEAKMRMDAVLKTLKPDDPQVVRVQLYLTSIMTANGQADEAVKILEGLLNKVSDPTLKAAAYNALGDCYQASKKPKEALWQYLWVDVIYNQDKTEHVKALQNIARLFDDFKDEARAKQYRDKLAKYQ